MRILACVVFVALVSCANSQHTQVRDPRACVGSTLDIGRNQIWVNREGTGALTVVFEAGFGNDSTVWSAIAPRIRATGVQTFVYDRAGMGKSTIDTAAPYSFANDVDILRTALSRCGIAGPVVMVGHSYGGAMSLLAAVEDPLIKGVVLIDSMVPYAWPPSELDKNMKVMRAQYDEIRAICRSGDHWVDGNCSGRSEQTYTGRLVYRALTAARLGWATNVWVLTSSSRPQNDGYPSPYSFNVRSMLYETALAQVCTEDDDYWSFQPGWDQLKFFNNPRGRGSCWAAVTRAINGRFHYRTVTAFINGTTGRQWAGVHHKLVMFGRDAMFQGSFNAYPSEVTSDVSTTYDSKLVENGAIILDPDYVNDQVSAFDEAWATASPIIGGE